MREIHVLDKMFLYARCVHIWVIIS